uniref:Uncharacterized protein n=1 Tax=Sphaerodactylus townsendi TaxID=933632 RepID=A0ACB8G272_9SAUR
MALLPLAIKQKGILGNATAADGSIDLCIDITNRRSVPFSNLKFTYMTKIVDFDHVHKGLHFLCVKVTADHIIFHDTETSSDLNEECICSMELPDTAFPTSMVTFLERALGNFTSTGGIEEEKVSKIHFRIIEFQNKLDNLTKIINQYEGKGFKDNADYLRVQGTIAELENIGKDLSIILNATDGGIDRLIGRQKPHSRSQNWGLSKEVEPAQERAVMPSQKAWHCPFQNLCATFF